MPKAKGTDKGGRKSKLDGSRKLPSNSPLTLSALGVTKKVSARCGKLAQQPESKIDKEVMRGIQRYLRALTIESDEWRWVK